MVKTYKALVIATTADSDEVCEDRIHSAGGEDLVGVFFSLVKR